MGILVALIVVLIIIAPIIVIAMIVSAIVKKKNSDSSKSLFEETIRAIYVYIILICALCAIIGGVISTFIYGLDVLLPEEEYEETELSQEREHNENIVDLSTNLSILLVAIPVFIYHSKIAKNANKDSELPKNTENVEKSQTN